MSLRDRWRAAGSCLASAVLVSVLLAQPAAWATEAVAQREGEVATGKITVLHTNDMHGYYTLDTRNRAIGFPILQTIRESVDPDLVLDAGDTFHGQSFATVTEGEGIAELVDALGFDATTPGNHDWSYGPQRLAQIDDQHGFTSLPPTLSMLKRASRTSTARIWPKKSRWSFPTARFKRRPWACWA